MNLKALFPQIAAKPHAQRIQELMRGFLYRSNFVPGVRHVLGWRGLKDCSTAVGGWTAKIKGYAGVFGLYFQTAEVRAGWLDGHFGLAYFPDPNEDVIENLSVAGAIYAHRDVYLPHIREFMSHDRLTDIFTIGCINLAVPLDEKAVLLGLESMDRQCSIAGDGIFLPTGHETVEVVPPGGTDQDFPSTEIAEDFWRVIANSVAFNLQQAPRYLRRIRSPGWLTVYDAAGHHRKQPTEEIHMDRMLVGFGCADFGIPIAGLGFERFKGGDVFVWQSGDPLPQAYSGEIWWRTPEISDFKTLDKQGLGIDERPQLIVLTGFLGAGKTSFLQHFIESQTQRSRFVAVIQNEIGEIGLDGKLLNDDYAVTEIDEGCLCCTLVGNLKKALYRILSRFQPDTVVLETTGLANPLNLMDELVEVAEQVRFDSVTTVVDCANFWQTLSDYRVAVDQIRAADIVLLNKVDLVAADEPAKIRDKVQTLNPRALILVSDHGDIPPALLYGTDPFDTRSDERQPGNEPMGPPSHPTHGADGLNSCKIFFQQPVNHQRMVEALNQSMPHTVFRVKGIVDLENSEMPKLVQYVGGRYEFSEFTNPNVSERFLIFIGQDLHRNDLEKLFY
jgi:G3E family GTPase